MKQEVNPGQKLLGKLSLPPDKSISHRSVMFAALHEGTSNISNFSSAADPQSTLSCLKQLGVKISQHDDNVIVEGVGREGLKTPEEDLDCGNSGTTMRLMSGILGGAGIDCVLVGDESLSGRTMKRIIDPLRKMNINISGRDDNFAPLHIEGGASVSPVTFELPIPSAQLKSCVLLAGLFGDDETKVIETTPSRDHTERLLNLPQKEEENRKTISSSKSCPIPEQTYRIPNDFSAAAFWLVAGSIHREANIKLGSVGLNPTRTGALDVLERMGANILITNKRTEGAEPVGDLLVKNGQLHPVTIGEDLIPNCIDELPILIIAMLFAEGASVITGAEELRHKETDRLAAMADILNKAGADFLEFTDGFEIHGDPNFIPQASEFQSYHDHRIAMAAAVLAIMGNKSSMVLNAECTAISYPSFWDDLSTLTN